MVPKSPSPAAVLCRFRDKQPTFCWLVRFGLGKKIYSLVGWLVGWFDLVLETGSWHMGPGWPPTWNSPILSLLSAGVASMCDYIHIYNQFLFPELCRGERQAVDGDAEGTEHHGPEEGGEESLTKLSWSPAST